MKNNIAINNNNLNKKQNLEHGLKETNLEEGINNSVGTSGNVAAVNDSIKHLNVSTVDVCNYGERKSCACTKTTLWADQWGFYQLNEFLGWKCPKQIKPKTLFKKSTNMQECYNEKTCSNQKMEWQVWWQS